MGERSFVSVKIKQKTKKRFFFVSKSNFLAGSCRVLAVAK
jgi:hypothetical protein